ncbi:hypothetical protein NU688_19775 [Variovorax sp. ZS18.2.2]|uniref:hypothetical protein n=1 Tax=Variovorax sp. ZS18.2.2 TaxID=2971255 RepID=UPI0021514815|nr:hypothetical protein [Variovorax sp. ZS18.2.2]MCR6478410.1 hypothetical protein [Variovorax sp. ZS18.2.2]
MSEKVRQMRAGSTGAHPFRAIDVFVDPEVVGLGGCSYKSASLGTHERPVQGRSKLSYTSLAVAAVVVFKEYGLVRQIGFLLHEVQGVSLMLMDMVPDMKRSWLGLVLAIGRDRRPGELGWQQKHQDDKQAADHRGILSMRYEVAHDSRSLMTRSVQCANGGRRDMKGKPHS